MILWKNIKLYINNLNIKNTPWIQKKKKMQEMKKKMNIMKLSNFVWIFKINKWK